MTSAVLTIAAETAEQTRELPMPAIMYFVITFALFLLLLGVTWSFRNNWYKHQQHSAPTAHDEHGHTAVGHHGQGHTGIDQGTHR